jgi:hypothetical protein
MISVTIELDQDLEEVLEKIAACEQKSAQDLCREAVVQFLRERVSPDRLPHRDRYAAFRKMIGLVKKGPTDASVHHDFRTGETP